MQPQDDETRREDRRPRRLLNMGRCRAISANMGWPFSPYKAHGPDNCGGAGWTSGGGGHSNPGRR
jgi:hypothetical protein